MIVQNILTFCQPGFAKSLDSSPDSPPSTPKSEVPSKRKELRFVDKGFPSEWCEMYRPGGFHPVDLGDKFRDGTYAVIRKLGNGSYSTVWLAIDSSNKRYVALKIFTAKSSVSETELEIIQILSQKADTDSRSQYIVTLLDTFVHQGPNGKHRCLVFEVMGLTAQLLVEYLNPSMTYPMVPTYRFPKSMAKRIFSHVLLGLAFLHENNIVHGDVQPGNLLFAINDITNVEENQLKQDGSIPGGFFPLHRLDGKPDKWAPNNLHLGQPLEQYTVLGPDMKAKISDLGSAFWANNPPSKHTSPIALRAPELILGKPLGPPIDIWAFGCLLFEFLVGQSLFSIDPFGTRQNQRYRHEMDDDHLIQFNDIIQKLPDNLLDDWPRAKKCFHPVTRQPRKKSKLHEDSAYDSLEIRFARDKPDDIDEAESAVICSLLRQILVYAPEERPEATELLRHPWFLEQSSDSDVGHAVEVSSE